MATAAAIQAVKDNIETDAAIHGFDDTAIAARLDSGQTVNKVSAVYWRRRATQTIGLVNTSESGSSRALDSIYPRMVATAEKYEALVLDEEAEVIPTWDRLGSIPIKRV